MLRDKRTPSRDAEQIGIDALIFIGGDLNLLERFLSLSGLTADMIRVEAESPAFFVGLLDFVLAHEPTLMAFAARAGLDPSEVQIARQKLMLSVADQRKTPG